MYVFYVVLFHLCQLTFLCIFSDLNAGNSLEIQEKLERLNQIMSEDWQRIDPARRMFLSQSKTKN
jgi:hypothetical protein